jgi:hypothetical protein
MVYSTLPHISAYAEKTHLIQPSLEDEFSAHILFQLNVPKGMQLSDVGGKYPYMKATLRLAAQQCNAKQLNFMSLRLFRYLIVKRPAISAIKSDVQPPRLKVKKPRLAFDDILQSLF